MPDFNSIPAQITTVSAVVENNQGEILLLFEDPPDAPFCGWSFFGCEIGWGEDLISPCIRYIQQLTGLKIELTQLTGVYSNVGNYKGENDHPTNVNFVFKARVTGGRLTEAEGVKTCWVSREAAVGMIALESIQMRVQDALDFDGRVCYSAFSNEPFRLYLKTYLTDRVI